MVAGPAVRALVDRKEGWSLGDGFQLSGVGAIALPQFNRHSRAPTVRQATARRVLHTAVRSHHWKAQAFSCHSLSVLGKGLPSLIKHQVIVFVFVFYQKGAVEKDLSPHTTPALGKDMRTLGSFHRTLDEMQDMETPEATAALNGWLRPACQQLHHSTVI